MIAVSFKLELAIYVTDEIRLHVIINPMIIRSTWSKILHTRNVPLKVASKFPNELLLGCYVIYSADNKFDPVFSVK